jgi:two-component sensor histidine kinase
MATIEGADRVVHDANPAFCRLINRAREEIVGKPICALLPNDPDCLALLEQVYRTGKFGCLEGQEHAKPGPIFSSYIMWPVTRDGRTSGVVIQVTETASLHAQTMAMNEALLLGSLRQHELTASAEQANRLLQAEIAQRLQSERDALMLTNEISHRIKNNLQIVVALIGSEMRQIPAQLRKGYVAMEARIAAIAELYKLISRSSGSEPVPLDAYLQELARTMSASLLEPSSPIRIEVEAESLEIDADRAVPFGLAVNELGTNAIKHAFPAGSGLLKLSLAQLGDQIELIVADDGVGVAGKAPSTAPGRHGSDYVAIFVRQLGGTIAVSGSPGSGTVVRILFPLVCA